MINDPRYWETSGLEDATDLELAEMYALYLAGWDEIGLHNIAIEVQSRDLYYTDLETLLITNEVETDCACYCGGDLDDPCFVCRINCTEPTNS
mgnify:CR=1 FL=1